MKACDKTLATTLTLRDNAVIGTPAMVADRWPVRQEAHGSPEIVDTRSCGCPLPQVWVRQSRRLRCEPGEPGIYARQSPARSAR